jgi:hypothetical protein
VVNDVRWEIETSPGTWLDITGDVYQRDTPQITHGRSDEQSQFAPSRMFLTLDNRDGKYSPRNPLSPLYGMIGRNTPVRCKIDNGSFTRFSGEISGLPPRWDPSHADNHIPVEAYGLLRRLGQGQAPVSNALRDWIEFRSTLMAYYPLHGGEEKTFSQNLAPNKTGSFRGFGGSVFKYGVDMGAAWLDTGMELNATGDIPYMQGIIDGAGTNVALDFVFQSPALGVLDIEIWPGLDEIWTLTLNTSGDAGTAQVSWYDGDFTTLTGTATAAIPELNDIELHTCRFELRTIAGPNVEWFFYIDGVLIQNSTFAGTRSITKCPFFRFHYSRFTNQTVMNMAHLAFWADNTAANLPSALDYTDAAFAYTGETAIDRIVRVAADGDIPMTTAGVAADSMPMGPQFSDTRLDQIREVEETDMGLLIEQRNGSGLLYRSRTSLYNQTPQFTLNYALGQVSPPLEPIDDDQVTRNDVTATRREAGSDRYTIDTGALGTQDPPTGVGRYATDITVNPETDGFLKGLAAWVANIGTLDQARWPSVTVNLNNPNIPTLLRDSIKDADIGDVFTITGMQKAFIYDDVSLMIIGYTESISPFAHIITFNCKPADPFTVGLWSTSSTVGTFRWDTGGSTLNSAATATATSMSFATSTGNALWTTDSNAFPFEIAIGGERVRVTNITGASSPQTATVVRSINGVVKAQSAGTDVRLWDTPRWAL